MDALSELLKALRLDSGLFLEAEFTAPWCIDSAPAKEDIRHILPDAEHVALYHLVTEGRCRASLPDTGETVDAERGDLILFPHGDGHRLGSDVTLSPAPASELVVPSSQGGMLRIRHGGGGALTRLACGYLACDKRLCRPLLDALPRLVHVKLGSGPAATWIEATLRHGALESQSPRPGSEALLARLSELLFIEAMREYSASLPASERGWLAGLRDEHVGRALTLMHADPARGWEVEALGREVGLSRSALNDRFNVLLGEPPMQYLTRWRLALGAQALATTNDAVARIAERVGYESEAAFNRAFKREFALPPAAWRKSVRLTRRAT